MCLTEITNKSYRETEWFMAWKVMTHNRMTDQGKHDIQGEFYGEYMFDTVYEANKLNLRMIEILPVLLDLPEGSPYGHVQTVTYPSGFHCFEKQEDALNYLENHSPARAFAEQKVVQVKVKNILCEGTQVYHRGVPGLNESSVARLNVVVTEFMEIPKCENNKSSASRYCSSS